MCFSRALLAGGVAVVGQTAGFAAFACSSSGARTATPTVASVAADSGPATKSDETAGPDPSDAGVRSEVRPLPDWDNPEVAREKWLYLDIRNPGAWKAEWREARVVLTKFDVPANRTGAVLTIAAAWGHDGNHRAHTDPKSDHAVILVDGQVAEEGILEATAVLQAPTRPRASGSGTEVVPVFEVRVARADDPAFKRKPWPEPRAARYAGPEPSVGFEVPVVAGRLSAGVVQHHDPNQRRPHPALLSRRARAESHLEGHGRRALRHRCRRHGARHGQRWVRLARPRPRDVHRQLVRRARLSPRPKAAS